MACLAEQAIFLGKYNRADGHVAAFVREMKLDARGKTGKHSIVEVCFLQDAERVVAGGAVEHLLHARGRKAEGGGMGCDKLPAAVAALGVRVPHPAGELDELTDVADEQRAVEA